MTKEEKVTRGLIKYVMHNELSNIECIFDAIILLLHIPAHTPELREQIKDIIFDFDKEKNCSFANHTVEEIMETLHR